MGKWCRAFWCSWPESMSTQTEAAAAARRLLVSQVKGRGFDSRRRALQSLCVVTERQLFGGHSTLHGSPGAGVSMNEREGNRARTACELSTRLFPWCGSSTTCGWIKGDHTEGLPVSDAAQPYCLLTNVSYSAAARMCPTIKNMLFFITIFCCEEIFKTFFFYLECFTESTSVCLQ